MPRFPKLDGCLAALGVFSGADAAIGRIHCLAASGLILLTLFETPWWYSTSTEPLGKGFPQRWLDSDANAFHSFELKDDMPTNTWLCAKSAMQARTPLSHLQQGTLLDSMLQSKAAFQYGKQQIRTHRLSVQGVLLGLLPSSSAFPQKHRTHIALLGGPFFSAACAAPAIGISFLETYFWTILVAFWGVVFGVSSVTRRGERFGGIVRVCFSRCRSSVPRTEPT